MIVGQQPICLSGGAEGADEQWGMCAGMAGHQVVHFSFARHRIDVPKSEIVVLTYDQLALANEFLHQANQTMERKFPTNSEFVNNLLRRNWYQVRHTERVYAVSDIKDGLVQGGTGWAVQMFLDRHENAPCECYVFDQKVSQWYVWTGEWTAIHSPPPPHGVWTGIGTRKLNPIGKAAIRQILNYSPTHIAAISQNEPS